MKQNFISFFIGLALLAGVSLSVGCANTGNIHSLHNDTYIDNGGKSFALAKVFGVELVPIKLGLKTDSHDHSGTQVGATLTKERISDFKAKVTNIHGVTREYGLGAAERDPDEDAIKPIANLLSTAVQLKLGKMGGAAAALLNNGDPGPDDVDAAIDQVKASDDADDSVLEELQALRDQIESTDT